MSQLMILTTPSLALGFHLAGVHVMSAEDLETAQVHLVSILDSHDTGLLAIDSGILEDLDSSLLSRLESAENLQVLSIPGAEQIGVEASRRARIVEMIRSAIGFHVTFRRKSSDEGEQAA